MSNALIDTVKEENQALATTDMTDESMAVRLSCLDDGSAHFVGPGRVSSAR